MAKKHFKNLFKCMLVFCFVALSAFCLTACFGDDGGDDAGKGGGGSWVTGSFTEGDFTYLKHPNGTTCTLYSYNGNSRDVVVPSTAGGLNVTKIGEASFRGSFDSIEISEGIEELEDKAFFTLNIDYLGSLTLPNSLRIIGESAIQAQGLQELVVPDGVTTIGDGAFSGSYQLRELTIGAGVTSVGEQIISDCDNIQTVYWNAPNATTLDSNGISTFGYWRTWDMHSAFTLVIGENITVIKDDMFNGHVENWVGYNCGNGVKNVIVKGAVTSIGARAFNELDLESIVFEKASLKTLRTIGEKAFYDCNNLVSLNSIDGVTKIGRDAFTNTAFHFINASDPTKPGNFPLPGSLGTIESEIFNGCFFAEINIPEGITTIKDRAFDGAHNQNDTISNMYLPKTIQTIGDDAFATGTRIWEVSAPAHILTSKGLTNATYNTYTLIVHSGTVLLEDTFAGFGNMRELTLPDTITSLENNALKALLEREQRDPTENLFNRTSTNNLTDIWYLGSENNPYLILCKYQVSSETDCEIEENTKIIYQNAFTKSNYTQTTISLTIPSSVSQVGAGAFSHNNIIVGEIHYAGGYNDWLKIDFVNASCPKTSTNKLYINNSQDISELDGDITIATGITTIPNYTFRNSKIASVTFPSSLEYIGASAFQNCSHLQEVTIPSSVNTIDENAFENCANLEAVTFESANIKLKKDSFTNCLKLIENATADEKTGAKYLGNNSNPYMILYYLPDEIKTKVKFTAHNNTKLLYPEVFSRYYNLVSVTLPNGVSYTTTGDNNDFKDCVKLKEYLKTGDTSKVEIDANGFVYYITSSSLQLVAYEGEETDITLPNPTSLNPIVLGEGAGTKYYAYSLGDYVFAYCDITSVTLSKAITAIPSHAFYYCTNLTSIQFSLNAETPSTITQIGDYAFARSGITSIMLPNEITEIGNYAFFYCTSLVNVTLPEGITKISGYMFAYCSLLASVELPENITEIGEYAFYFCQSLTSVDFSALEGNDVVIKSFAFTFDSNSTISTKFKFLDLHMLNSVKIERNAIGWWNNSNSIERTLILPRNFEVSTEAINSNSRVGYNPNRILYYGTYEEYSAIKEEIPEDGNSIFLNTDGDSSLVYFYDEDGLDTEHKTWYYSEDDVIETRNVENN